MRFPTSLVTRKAIVFGATLLVGASGTHAADQLVLGKKLVIKNPPAGTASNKVVHLGKDPAITVGAAGSAGDPRCTGAGGGGTSSLRIAASGGAGDVTISLPCTGWKTNAANTLYKYKDSTGFTCKLVLVKGGVLVKAVCKGAQVAINLNGTMSPVGVVTTLNSEVYCTEFGGTSVNDGSDGKTFLRKDAPAPVGCPTSSTTTSSTTSSTVDSSTTSTSTSSTTSSTVCTDLIQDGGFEQGTSGWTYSSTNFGTPRCSVADCGTGTGTGPRTGSWWVWLGGTSSAETAFVNQQVNILPGTATLTFWLEIPACATGGAADVFSVRVDGAQVYSTTNSDPDCNQVGYAQRSVDLSVYADGGSHAVEIRGVFASGHTSGITNFFVDDVRLDNCSSSP